MPNLAELPIREKPQIRRVPISSIRRDGSTQHRKTEDADLIAEYAELMHAGVEFPPVRLWWDGADYWLSDGFRRVAAAERVGLGDVAAEVRRGELGDAQWDSYAANATQGTRRSAAETEAVIRLAVAHPNSSGLSTCELARHLQNADFGECVRTLLWCQAGQRVAHREATVRQYDGQPDYWAQDLQKENETAQMAVGDPEYALPIDLAGPSGPERLRTAHQFVGAYGRLLSYWPAIVDRAREIGSHSAGRHSERTHALA